MIAPSPCQMKMDKSLSQRVMLAVQWVVLVLVYFMGDFEKGLKKILRDIEVKMEVKARDYHIGIFLNSDMDEVMMTMVDHRGVFGV
jgi:hypothetical protein